MLQILRNKSQSIVIQAIVVVIALVFIFWGVGTNLMRKRDSAIVVNDEEISFQEFQKAYDRMYNNVRNQFGGNVPQGLLESLGIKNQVINQLIQESLLRQGAAAMGIQVSREEVQETIKNMIQFQDNGAFSIEKYKALLAANGFSPTTFEQSVQFDMLSQKARTDIGEFAATVSEFEIQDLYQLEKSTVAIRYVDIVPEEYTGTIEVDEKELQEWYDTAKDNYKTEPQVKLKYLDFSYAGIGKKITIDDATAEKYYQDNIALYTGKEKRHARHILFKADENSSAEIHKQQEQKAKEILEMARKGDDFAELAKQYSEGPSKDQGGDLGFFSRGQMVRPFEDAAFSLKEGEISDVVKTSFGYHIIKLEEITPPKIQPLDTVKESIITKLQTEQAKPLAFQVANEAYEGIIGAGSLDAYLKENPDVEVKQTDFFSRSNPPTTIINDPNFLNGAFSLKEKELSSLIETSQGYAILFADEVKEPQVPELSDVLERATADFTQHKAKAAAEASAQSLLEKAKEEKDLAKAAEAGGFTAKESDYLGKNSAQESSLPQGLIDAAFNLSVNSPFPEKPLQSSGNFYVFEFLDRKIPQTPLSDEEKERYRNAIIQLKQQQILSGWLANQRKEAKIFTHKRL